jgi:hypothetical protein
VAVLSVRGGVRGSMCGSIISRSGVRGSTCDSVFGSKWCSRFDVWQYYRFEVVFEVLLCCMIGSK